jgi:hypothetical protein
MSTQLEVWSMPRKVRCKGGETRQLSAKRLKAQDDRVYLCHEGRRERFHVSRDPFPSVYPDLHEKMRAGTAVSAHRRYVRTGTHWSNPWCHSNASLDPRGLRIRELATGSACGSMSPPRRSTSTRIRWHTGQPGFRTTASCRHSPKCPGGEWATVTSTGSPSRTGCNAATSSRTGRGEFQQVRVSQEPAWPGDETVSFPCAFHRLIRCIAEEWLSLSA